MSRIVALLFHDVYEHSSAESGFGGAGAERYKLSRPEFEAQLDGLRAVRSDAPVALAGGAEPPAAAGHRPRFAITVDDGGLSYYTIVADRLEALGWRGHCFVTTGYIGRPGFLDRPQLRELHARGHVIGSHSVSHPPRFSACSWPEMVREWSDSRHALADILGADVAAASVPGGYFSRAVAQAAHEAGLRVLFTSEPQTRPARLFDCTVMGRFTIRHGHRLDFARRLAAAQPTALYREWLAWNAKKLVKTCLGDTYVRLAQRGRAGQLNDHVVHDRPGGNH